MALFVCLFIHLFREKELVKVLAKTKKNPSIPAWFEYKVDIITVFCSWSMQK